MKLYISGPITLVGIEDARESFRDAETRLKGLGFETVNPTTETPQFGPGEWLDYMRTDIKLLVDCDGIFMLKDYHLSKGAGVELELATGLGLKVLYDTPTWQMPGLNGKY